MYKNQGAGARPRGVLEDQPIARWPGIINKTRPRSELLKWGIKATSVTHVVGRSEISRERENEKKKNESREKPAVVLNAFRR
jgi:hypothetical protein